MSNKVIINGVDVIEYSKKVQEQISNDAKRIAKLESKLISQEKLLELYRKYKEVSEVTFYTINYKTLVENTRIAKELIKQINQLEKELEK